MNQTNQTDQPNRLNQQPPDPQIHPEPDSNLSHVGHHPEHPPTSSAPQFESASIYEVGAEQDLDPEVAEFMQRVESDKVALNEPIVMHGKPIVQPPHWQNSNTPKLPTSKQTIIKHVKGKATESVTWLANWCFRIIKKFHGQVIYTDLKPPTPPPPTG